MEGRDLGLCPLASQSFPSKCQDVNLVLSQCLLGSEEILGKWAEEKCSLVLVSNTCGSEGRQRDLGENEIHTVSPAAKKDLGAGGFPVPG